MQFSTKTLLALLAFALPILAQDDSVCDPQNDDNNDSTCTSSAGQPAQTMMTSSTALTGRLSLVSNTVTDTNIIIQQSTDVVLGTTSLPKSLYTDTTRNTIVATTVVSGTYVYTSSYDPNTVNAVASSTSDGAAAGITAAALPGAAIAALGFAAALL
ncbi:hypothetical protein K490DRAFT_55686 [Saccharata proteae CBS 121410]|uniref:Uncharacterized protein n=1 Tax=Saccharata proteae CBS 121410 TaxID=1314787 RepID=A0A6A5YBK3_9PEZI|nr:hypothetical protein K490DRAFT_55686 [Saccharata proteae CBS 121410]